MRNPRLKGEKMTLKSDVAWYLFVSVSILLWFLFSIKPARANTLIVNCSSTNLGLNYGSSAPSANTQYQGMRSQAHMSLSNPTATTICMDTGSNTATPPANGGIDEHCAQPGAIVALDNVTINAYAYLRASGASCLSASFAVDIW